MQSASVRLDKYCIMHATTNQACVGLCSSQVNALSAVNESVCLLTIHVHADEAARLREEVSSADAQIKQMHADLQAWEEAVSSRDTELRNLQVSFNTRLVCQRSACFQAANSTSNSSSSKLGLHPTSILGNDFWPLLYLPAFWLSLLAVVH